LAWLASLTFLVLFLVQGSASAATIQVPGLFGCELWDAIRAANVNWFVGGCNAGDDTDDGGDIIELQTDVPLDRVRDTTYNRSGLPLVTSKVTIEGNGYEIYRIPSARSFRLIAVTPTGDLTLENLGLRNGRVNNYGGAVLNVNGTVSLSMVTLSDNRASKDGGGVYSAAGTLNITDSSIVGNIARDGGGVWNGVGGNLTFERSTLAMNLATGSGGGVDNRGAAEIVNSTISGNEAEDYGGGIRNRGALIATNSTLTANTAFLGGGLIQYGGGANLVLNGNVVAGNSADSAAEVANYSGPVVSDFYNLFGQQMLSTGEALVNVVPGGNDLVATSDGPNTTPLAALIDPVLANNGGPTDTHALVPGSLAVDWIPADADGCATEYSNGDPITEDERGVGRPQPASGSCDTGAVEMVAVPVPAPVVVYPGAAGIVVNPGQTIQILWKGFTPAMPKVKIHLYDGDKYVTRVTGYDIVDNSGSYLWTIPADLSAGNDYRIRVISTWDESIIASSDNPFTVGGYAPIGPAEVTYPTESGIALSRGSTVAITWSGFEGTVVRVQLYDGDDYVTRVTEFEATDNDGAYNWTIPSWIKVGSDYRIRVAEEGSPVSDLSDNPFEIF
jgi:hypothetical protein